MSVSGDLILGQIYDVHTNTIRKWLDYRFPYLTAEKSGWRTHRDGSTQDHCGNLCVGWEFLFREEVCYFVIDLRSLPDEFCALQGRGNSRVEAGISNPTS
jgi:hypothetical protein